MAIYADHDPGAKNARPPVLLRALKWMSVQASIALLTVALLDALLYFTLPDGVASRLPGYREGFYLSEWIGRGYPRGYFEPNAERGFDIKPTEAPRNDLFHYTDDGSFRIWSNSIGCFDTPFSGTPDRFWYIAGDSIAWGHARYDDLMGTVIEKKKGVDVLQCGVTHTGQRHQFAKFLEIGAKLGRWPERVLVFYSPTDTANDYAHPHATVIEGGLADIRLLKADNGIAELDRGWFDQVKAERSAAKPTAEGRPTSFSPARLLLEYSVTAQLLNAGLHSLNRRLPVGQLPVLGDDPTLDWPDKYVTYKGQKLYDIHRLTHQQTLVGHLQYADFKHADANKHVIREWRDHARANGYALEFVLPHPGPSSLYPPEDATNFYKEFIAYLSSLGIKHYDVTAELNKRKIRPDDLYWYSDIHMSGEGNQIVGGILAELL